MSNSPPVVTNPKIEHLKTYIEHNKDHCRDCGAPIFWCNTANNKRIPIDFPNYALRGNAKPTVSLVPEAKDGSYTGRVEAWPGSGATHTVHFDTCKERKRG